VKRSGGPDQRHPVAGPVVSLLAGLPWPAVLVDIDGGILFQNKAAKRLQEVPDGSEGNGFGDLYPARASVLTGDPPWLTPQQASFTSRHGDSAINEQVVLGTIPDVGAYLLFVDNSEAVRAELARSQTERLASIGFMLAGVCHEVSNPLAATYSMVQLLQSQPELTEEMFRASLEKIAANVKRILEVSRTVYEFSRVGERQPLPIDLAIQEALEMLSADRRFECVALVHEPDYQAVIRIDRVRLRQAFFNLLLNAAQAIAGHGEIKVTTSRQSLDSVIVTVEDNGPGIPIDSLDRLFEPFFTNKPSGEGTGLGLAITHDIVREHRGTISASNRIQGGACFRLEFPLDTYRPL
jgi:signal transduction histidine kinase